MKRLSAVEIHKELSVVHSEEELVTAALKAHQIKLKPYRNSTIENDWTRRANRTTVDTTTKVL